MRALALPFCLCCALLLPGCSLSAGGSFVFTDADQRLAVERYKTALAKEPGDWVLQRRLGLAYFDLKDYALAEQSLTRVQALSPGEPESLLYLGLSRIGKGEREAGLDLLADFRWPFKFYHQKFVREEAARLRRHPDQPAGEAIRDILEALEKGKVEQWHLENDKLGGFN